MSFLLPNADGYIFDFNGTLILDGSENREAWNRTAIAVRGKGLEDDEFLTFNGRTDSEAVHLLAPSASPEEEERIIRYKEDYYKDLCIGRGMTLAPGAEEFLSLLKETGKPMAIASSAPRMNMDWYIPYFGLLRFFREDLIIAGRTDIPSKPDPAIFLLAARMLGASPDRTIIFEDSPSGVSAALASGAMLTVRLKNPGEESIHAPGLIETDSFRDLLQQGDDALRELCR